MSELRHIAAQLTAAIAADSRAMTFMGYLITVIVVVVGAGLALLDSDKHFLSSVALLLALGLATSAYFAFQAAKPIDFEFVGYRASNYVDDILNGVSDHDAHAELASHLDQAIKDNEKAMEAAASSLERAVQVAYAIVGLCFCLVLGFWIAKIIPATW